jgi:hypothetical protein
MRWRRVLKCSIATFCTLTVALVVWAATIGPSDVPDPEPPAPHPIDHDWAEPGMMRAEIIAMVGEPRDINRGCASSLDGGGYRRRGYVSWVGYEQELLVMFDERDVAVDVRRVPVFFHGRRWDVFDWLRTRVF